MELRIIILSVACFSSLVPPAYSHGILAAKAAIGAAAALKGAALLKAGALAKGAAVVAAKGAAVALAAKGAVALKGAALKGAALLAKGAATKGAALLAAKGAAAKGVLAAKAAALSGAVGIGATAIKAAGALGAIKASALHSLLHKPKVHIVQYEPQEVRVVHHKPQWVEFARAPSFYVPARTYHSHKPFHAHHHGIPLPIPEVPPGFPSILQGRLSGLWNIATNSIEKTASASGELLSALHQAKLG